MELQTVGFSPAPDEIVKEFGPACAVVFGRVWRYCQMKDGVCRASVKTIGNGMSWNTVKGHLETLTAAGYLIDTTPDEKFNSHVYSDAGKFVMRLSAEKSDPIPPQKLNTPSSEIEYPPPQKLRTPSSETEDKDSIKKEYKKERKKEGAKTPRASLFPLAEAIAKVCHINLEANPRIFQDAKLLAKIKSPAPTPELIEQHYNGNPSAFWRAVDWRGKKGNNPTPAAIRETWGQWDAPQELSAAEQWAIEKGISINAK